MKYSKDKAIEVLIFFLFRIRTDSRGGAWCPKAQITHNTYEWLEVDLGEIKEVTLVEIQGRFGNGQVVETVLLSSKYYILLKCLCLITTLPVKTNSFRIKVTKS